MNVAEITRQLFSELEKRGIRYCIYNGYEYLPNEVKSDLDIAIEKRAFNDLDYIIYKCSENNNSIVLHKIWHDPWRIAYIISPLYIEKPYSLQLDFFGEFTLRDYKKNNTILRYLILEEDELLLERNKKDYFYIPSPYLEFFVKLTTMILKASYSQEKFAKILELYQTEKNKAQDLIIRFFQNLSLEICSNLEKNNFEWFEKNRDILIKALKTNKFKYLTPSRIFLSVKMIIHRILRPVGMTITFLGPDGCGKSAIVNKTAELLSKSFHGISLFYWRPELLKQPGVAFGLREDTKTDNPNPHDLQPEPSIKSSFRFLYYLFDFVIGYILKVYPLKIKKHLCIFDRYYYDVLVDKKRYNLSLPTFILKLPLPLIPKPDITFILDVPPQELYKRKQELPLSELERQRNLFLSLAKKLPNAIIIDNNRSLKESLNEITYKILSTKSYKTRGILKIKEDHTKK
jgi:thymidylate kinase